MNSARLSRRTSTLSTVVLFALLWAPTTVSAQTITDPIESLGPGTPFLVQPILPGEGVHLQNNFVPISTNELGGIEISRFFYSMRPYGVWHFTETVVGEASLPLLISLPDSDNSGFDVGNPMLGIEWSLMAEEGRQHRWTASFDMHLPLAQISNGESTPEDLEDAALRYFRYGIAASALPHMKPEYAPEVFTVVVGTNYRMRNGGFIMQVNFDIPLLLGFDFSEDIFFDEHSVLLRYGTMFGYDANPIFPTLEFSGTTHVAGNDTITTALISLGAHASFNGVEPGIGITFPITLGNDDLFDTLLYFHFDIGYSFGG